MQYFVISAWEAGADEEAAATGAGGAWRADAPAPSSANTAAQTDVLTATADTRHRFITTPSVVDGIDLFCQRR